MAKKVIVIKPRSDDGPPPEEGLPPWMATFADMVTLLLCFFVLLLSFSQQDMDKFRDVLGSLKDGFGVRISREVADSLALTPSKIPDVGQSLNKEDKVLLGIILRIRSLLEENPDINQGTGVRPSKEGALLWADNALMFRPGTADLSSRARAVLDDIAEILREYNYNLVVRGHTGHGEPTSKRYPTGWELSSARAANALHYLASEWNIPVTRMRAVGYSDTRPRVMGASASEDEQNRRLEFYFHLPEKDSW